MVFYSNFVPLTSQLNPYLSYPTSFPYQSLTGYRNYSYPYANYSPYGYPSTLALKPYPNTLSTAFVFPTETADDLLQLRVDPANLNIIPKELLERRQPPDNSEHSFNFRTSFSYHNPDQEKPYFPVGDNLIPSNMFSNFFSEIFTSPQNFQYILPDGRIGQLAYQPPKINSTNLSIDDVNRVIYDAKKAQGDNPVVDILGNIYEPDKMPPIKHDINTKPPVTTKPPVNINNSNNSNNINDVFRQILHMYQTPQDNHQNNKGLPIKSVFGDNYETPQNSGRKAKDNPLAAPFLVSEYNDYTGTNLGEYYHNVQYMQESLAEITKVKVPYIDFNGNPIAQQNATRARTGNVPVLDVVSESYGWTEVSPFYQNYVNKHIIEESGGVHDVISPRGFRPEDLFAGGRLTNNINPLSNNIYKSHPFKPMRFN
jgi:hypothetical protein